MFGLRDASNASQTFSTILAFIDNEILHYRAALHAFPNKVTLLSLAKRSNSTQQHFRTITLECWIIQHSSTFLSIIQHLLDHPPRWPNDPTLAIQQMLPKCWVKCWIVWPGIYSVSKLERQRPTSPFLQVYIFPLFQENPHRAARRTINLKKPKRLRRKSQNFRLL